MAPMLAYLLLLQQLMLSQQALLAPTPAPPRCAEKLSSCSCRLSDGQIVDLSPLQASPGPAFNDRAPDQYIYQYNPCLAYKCGAEGDAAVCQEKMQIIPVYVDFGLQSSAQFDTDSTTGRLLLRYLSHDMVRSSVLNLICDPGAAESSVSTQGAQGNQLTADLRSRYACPFSPHTGGGMSGGDILLIVCLVLLIVYLLAGVLFNRLARHQIGAQMLPNLAFWLSLPGLIADGSAYVYGRVRDLVCAKRGGGGGGYSEVK